MSIVSNNLLEIFDVTIFNMTKGIPEIKIRKLNPVTNLVQNGESGQFILHRFELEKNMSFQDLDKGYNGLIFVESGGVVLTVGGSVGKVLRHEFAEFPKGHTVNIKATENTTVVFLFEHKKDE